MRWYKKNSIFLYIWWLKVKWPLNKIKRRIWNKRILLWWHKLWIRKNAFHCSLDFDGEAMIEMNKRERERYFADIVRRKEIAWQREFAEC